MKKFRVIKDGEAMDMKAKNINTLARRIAGARFGVWGGDHNSPYYTITRGDKHGSHVVAQVVKY